MAFHIFGFTDVPKLPEIEIDYSEKEFEEDEYYRNVDNDDDDSEMYEEEDDDEELVVERQEMDDLMPSVSRKKRRIPLSPPRHPDPYYSEDSEWTSTVQVAGSIFVCVVIFLLVRKIV